MTETRVKICHAQDYEAEGPGDLRRPSRKSARYASGSRIGTLKVI